MERSKIRLGGISDKSIYYREMQVMASLPLTQVPFRFMHSGYRRWCGPWWKFYLNPKNYYREVIKIWKRGRYGWCVEDTFSLDCSLSLWMPYAVKATAWYILHYTKNTPNDEKKLYYSIVAWEALWHLGWNCECYDRKVDGMEHDKFWQRRYEFCMPIFTKTLRRLWW